MARRILNGHHNNVDQATLWLRIVSSLILLLILLTSPDTEAQQNLCDPSLVAVSGTMGYSARSNPMRCEGIYVATVSSQLELLSLTLGEVNYRLLPDVRIRAVLTRWMLAKSYTVFLRVVALPIRTYYRMDSIFPSGGIFQWPVSPVILAQNLSASRLGLFAWYEKNGNKRFIPVKGSEADTSSLGKTSNYVRIAVRSPLSLEGLVWRTYKEGDSQDLSWNKVIREPQRPGIPIAFSFPYEKDSLVTLNIRAKAEDRDDWEVLDLLIRF